VQFGFTGSLLGNGSYSASGTLTSPSNPPSNANWAAGEKDESGPTTTIHALQTHSGGATIDEFLMTIPRTTTGSSTVDIDCSSNCADMLVFFGFNTTTGTTQFICGLESGTLSISSISESRVSGTFSGSGSCLDDNFADAGTFAVTNGTFNVALVSGFPQ
jgi:hypothetical protein